MESGRGTAIQVRCPSSHEVHPTFSHMHILQYIQSYPCSTIRNQHEFKSSHITSATHTCTCERSRRTRSSRSSHTSFPSSFTNIDRRPVVCVDSSKREFRGALCTDCGCWVTAAELDRACNPAADAKERDVGIVCDKGDVWVVACRASHGIRIDGGVRWGAWFDQCAIATALDMAAVEGSDRVDGPPNRK